MYRVVVTLFIISSSLLTTYAQSGEGVCTTCTVPSLGGTQDGSGAIRLPTYVYAYLKAGETINFSGQLLTGGTYSAISNYNTDGWKLYAPTGQKTITTSATQSYTVGSGEGGIWTLVVPQGSANQWRSYGVNVLSGSTTITGRVYTLLLPVHQAYAGDGDGVDSFTLWYLNISGGLYKSNFNNYTGWDSNIYADAVGVADAGKDGYQPLRKSLPRSSATGSAVGSPNVAIVTNSGRATRFNSYDYNTYSANYYKQFFNQPDASMPTTAPIWNLTSNTTTATWLRPGLQTADLSNLKATVDGNNIIYTFSIASFNGTAATLRIDQDNNGTVDYTTTIPASSGANSYTLNAASAGVTISTNLKSTVLIDKSQEIHFVLDDVEGFGGLTLIRQNGGSGGTTAIPTLYWDDTSAEMKAQNSNPPTQTDGTAGVNSDVTGGVRGWAYNGNSNTSWGNNSYIDSWAYEVSSESETAGLLSITGTVYNDANGLTDNTVNGTATNAGGLFVLLVDNTNTVVAKATVGSNGSYTVLLSQGGTYSAVVSSQSVAVGTSVGSNYVGTLPSGWVYTGENLGSGTGNDGLANGVLSLGTVSANVTGANFGIEQLPAPTSSTLTAQVNPGGTTGVSIPPASFTGTDPDGTITSTHYTAFPTNVTSLTIGSTVYTAMTFPSGGLTVTAGTTVRIDPVDGTVTAVLPFRVIDNAGQESRTTGSVSVPFTTLSLAGTVYNDANGLTDNAINGTGTNTGGLFAVLTDAASSTVVANAVVASTGAYSFTGLTPSSYQVRLSSTSATVGSAAPVASVPTGYTFTGEGTAAAGDGMPNGITSVTLITANVTGVNFGLDQLPIPTSSTLTAQVNPGGTTGVSIPPASFTGTDSDGTVTATRYTAFPANVNSLTIGTTVYTSASFPASGVTAVTGTAIAIDPIDGTVTAVLPFRVIDNAGQESTTTGSVSVPFTTVILSGTVYNDANGLTDNSINGTGTNAGGLFAVLTDAASGTVVANVVVASTGVYSFSALNGGSYQVRLSTTSVTVGGSAPAATLPTGYAFTGEGTATTGDGTPNGITSVTLTTTNVAGVNFGLDQLPTPTSTTLATRANPGGSNAITVPLSSLTGTDPDGTVVSIHYTAFPTNVTTLYVGNTAYTSTSFPTGGVTAASTIPVHIDPADGAVTVVLPFRVIDNAGQESRTTATATIPFSCTVPLCPLVTGRKIQRG